MSEVSSLNDLYVKLTEAIEKTANTTSQELKNHIELENDKILNKSEGHSKNLETLKTQCNKIEARQIDFERRFRKNNILIFGLEFQGDNSELLPFVLSFLRDNLKITVKELDINNVYLLKYKEGPLTPIKV